MGISPTCRSESARALFKASFINMEGTTPVPKARTIPTGIAELGVQAAAVAINYLAGQLL